MVSGQKKKPSSLFFFSVLLIILSRIFFFFLCTACKKKVGRGFIASFSYTFSVCSNEPPPAHSVYGCATVTLSCVSPCRGRSSGTIGDTGEARRETAAGLQTRTRGDCRVLSTATAAAVVVVSSRGLSTAAARRPGERCVGRPTDRPRPVCLPSPTRPR